MIIYLVITTIFSSPTLHNNALSNRMCHPAILSISISNAEKYRSQSYHISRRKPRDAIRKMLNMEKHQGVEGYTIPIAEQWS